MRTSRHSERPEVRRALDGLRRHVVEELRSVNEALPHDMRLIRREINRIADDLIRAVREAPGWPRKRSSVLQLLRKVRRAAIRPTRRRRPIGAGAEIAAREDAEAAGELAHAKGDADCLPAGLANTLMNYTARQSNDNREHEKAT